MDGQFILDAIQNQGVAIVMLGVLCWYINKKDTEHKEEVKELSTAISELQKVVQKLVDYFDRKE